MGLKTKNLSPRITYPERYLYPQSLIVDIVYFNRLTGEFQEFDVRENVCRALKEK
jgi:hypothetical protein